MRKLNYLLASLALVLGVASGSADNVQPYKADFNTAIDVSDHAFKVAPGWSHIVDNAYIDYETMYVEYTYSSSQGVDGSGAIAIGSQTVSGSGWDAEEAELHDYLVTPAVSGKVTIQAKRFNYSHYLQIYKCTKNADGSFTVGDKLTLKDGKTTSKSLSDFGAFTYDTVQIGSFSEPTYLAIRGNGVYLDNFEADKADVQLVRSLKLTDESGINTSPDTRADGTYPVTLCVVLKNTGDYVLNPGDEGFSITVTERESGDTIGTVPLNHPIGIGETGKDTVTVYASYAKYPKQTAFRAHENISHTSYQYQSWFTPTPYLPVIMVRDANLSTLDSGATVSYGMLNKPVTKKFQVRNTGAKVLNVTSITLPAGFTVNKTAFTVEPHDTTSIYVTATAETPGIYSGELSINADEINPFKLKLSATVLDASKYYLNFEDGKAPAGAILSRNWKVADYNVDGNKYVLQNSLQDETLFVTPLLKVKEGEQMTFDAGKRSNNSFVNVYYSTDRRNWTKVDSVLATQMSNNYSSDGGWSSTRNYYLSTFVVNGVPAGNYYIAFGSGYANIDNIYGFELVPVTRDLSITDNQLPKSGSVNSNYHATATVLNVSANAEAAGSYTATLHLGNDSAEAEAVELAAGSSNKFSFDVTPHTAGTFKAYIEYAFEDGYKVTSDTVDVTVAAETASAEVQVGSNANGSTSTQVPVYVTYNNSESETVYPASMLEGLSPGTKITSITYKGYKGGAKVINTTLGIWIANTTDGPQTETPYKLANTDSMTTVYSGSYTYPNVGESNNHQPIITATLAEPFVYTGGNLRIIVRSENQDGWQNFQFETCPFAYTIARNNDNHDKFLGANYSLKPTPVVYLGVEREPASLSGTVKDSLGNAIAGAVVKLTGKGNVQYSDTTDASGSYSLAVMKDELAYTLRVDAANYEPFVEKDDSIKGNVTKNIVLKPATGLFVEDYNLPTTGTVNTTTSASITVCNDISQDIAASDYDATLSIGGEEVAKATNKADIASGKSAKLNFSFAPHKSGKYEIRATVKYGAHEYIVSDSITVEGEIFGGEFQVGDSTAVPTTTSTVSPWNNYYKKSQTVTIYTPQELGIAAGAKIVNVRFRGKFDSTAEGEEAVNMFIGNTTLQPSTDAAVTLFADTASMTRIYDVNKDSIPYGGSDGMKVHDVINANIPGGFVYTGGNIAIVFDGNHIDQSDNRLYFVVDNNLSAQTFGRYTDRGDLSTQSFSQYNYTPVMYISVQLTDSVKGKVVDKKTLEPIAGANVTLKSGDVEYYGTTDTTGAYGIRVGKPTLTYDAIFAAEGYFTDTISGISFDSSIVTVNDSLAPVPAVVNLTGTVKGAQRFANKTVGEAKPLANATVTVKAADGDAVIATVKTIADGTYSVDSLTEGTSYTVTFSADGYTDSVATVTAPDSDFVIDATLYSAKVKSNVTGTVTGAQRYSDGTTGTAQPIAATVTVTNAEGTTIATATADADGKYTVENLAEDSVYTFTFSAEGYKDSVVTVTASNEDKTVDVTLYSESVLTAIEGINAQNGEGGNAVISNGVARGNVYTIGGQFVGRDVDVTTLSRGVYIIGGKKITIK